MIRQLMPLCTLSVVGLLMLASPLIAGAAQKWEKQLVRDLVEIKGNKMIIETYELCKVGIFGELKFKTYSEAPENGLISRDKFVALTIVSMLVYQAELGDAECREMKSSDDDVDFELQIHMSQDGMKQKFFDHTSDEVHASEESWPDLF